MIECNISLASTGSARTSGCDNQLRLGYSKNRGIYRLNITQTGEWEGMTIRALWHTERGMLFSSLVEDGKIEVPAIVTSMPGCGRLVFEGSDGTRTLTSADIKYSVAMNSGTMGDIPEPPVPAWQQLVALVEQAKDEAWQAGEDARQSAAKANEAYENTIGAKDSAVTEIRKAETDALNNVEASAGPAASAAAAGAKEKTEKAIQEVKDSAVKEVKDAAAGAAARAAQSATDAASSAARAAQSATDAASSAARAAQSATDAASSAAEAKKTAQDIKGYSGGSVSGYTLPTATASVLGGVKTGSNITNSDGTISITKANVTAALGYTPPTTNTWRGVQDNLTSTATDQSLSANQGKVLKGLVDGKAASSHTHDDRYYTESEMNTKLNGKANASHTHDDRYYTESEMNAKLNGKANSSHTHNYAGSSSAGGTANSVNGLTFAAQTTDPGAGSSLATNKVLIVYV